MARRMAKTSRLTEEVVSGNGGLESGEESLKTSQR